MDFVELGPSPAEERCAQVGREGFDQANRDEVRRFIAGVKRYFGERYPGGTLPVSVTVRSFPHDFGAYRECVVVYDEGNQHEVDVAYTIDDKCPTTWHALEHGEPFDWKSIKAPLGAEAD